MSTRAGVLRKIKMAFKPLPFSYVRHLVNYNGAHMAAIQTYFTYRGVEMRFDYSHDLNLKLPKVDFLRNQIWMGVPEIHRREVSKRAS